MKRLFFTLFATITLPFSTHLLAQESFKIPEAVTKAYNQINISVFPQVELISIIQTLSEYQTVFSFLMSQDSSNYRTDVINHFKSYKNHPAVLMFDRLSIKPGTLNFSVPSNIMLYTDESLHLRADIKLDEFVISRAGGIDSLNMFLKLLTDFAFQSSFTEFYMSHRDFYYAIIDETIVNLGSIDYISELESFFGKNQKSYNIILVSLYNYVGFGNSLLCSNEQREIYNTMGPQMVRNNVPHFGNHNYLKYIIRHEFCHPYINPLTEKCWDYIKNYSYKYDSIPEVAREKVCGDWQECINEFVIRAITTQIAFNEANDDGLRSYKKENSKGVIYLDSLLEKIRYYQSNRKSYPTIESYYLNILDVFK